MKVRQILVAATLGSAVLLGGEATAHATSSSLVSCHANQTGQVVCTVRTMKKHHKHPHHVEFAQGWFEQGWWTR